MKLKIQLSCILFFFCLVAFGQGKQFSTSILVDNSGVNDPIFREFNETNMNMIYSVDSENVLFYDWNEQTNELIFSNKNKHKEKPANVIVFLKAMGGFDMNPELIIKADTSGKTTEAYFALIGEVKYLCKHIDAVSSTILAYYKLDYLSDDIIRLPISNFKKEFGGDPNLIKRSNPKKYRELEAQLRKNYKTKIEQKYREVYNNKNRLAKLDRLVLAGSRHPFEVLKDDTVDKKAKQIKFRAGTKDNVLSNDGYRVFVQKEIEGFTYFDDITNVAVDEVGDSISTASTVLFSSKELATALKSDAPMYLIKTSNVRGINLINSRSDAPNINIALKKDCLFCLSSIEKTLYACPIFTMVERNAPELKYFANLSKDERFIDYSVEDIQGKQLGYQLLFTIDNKNINVIETATNRVVSSIPLTVSMDNKNNIKINISQSNIQRILSDYNPDVFKLEWLKTLEVKKDKIQEILVYHPAGMDRYMEYDFFTMVAEEVDGETIYRKNKIGQGRIGKSYSPNISVLKVRDGHKDILVEQQSNSNIVIEVSDKSFR